MDKDLACCKLFKGGWVEKVMRRMKEIRPSAVFPAVEDPFWKERIGSQPSEGECAASEGTDAVKVGDEDLEDVSGGAGNEKRPRPQIIA